MKKNEIKKYLEECYNNRSEDIDFVTLEKVEDFIKDVQIPLVGANLIRKSVELLKENEFKDFCVIWEGFLRNDRNFFDVLFKFLGFGDDKELRKKMLFDYVEFYLNRNIFSRKELGIEWEWWLLEYDELNGKVDFDKMENIKERTWEEINKLDDSTLNEFFNSIEERLLIDVSLYYISYILNETIAFDESFTIR